MEERNEALNDSWEEFRESLAICFNVEAAFELDSLITYAIGSISTFPDREGLKEGVADGLCRQITKILVTEIVQRCFGHQTFRLVSEIITNAQEKFGIRQSIKDIVLDQEKIDLRGLVDSLLEYEGELYEWITSEYEECLTGDDKN